ncbi:MAG: sulfatase [Actinobacteria bacterium]|nr:sulfatase [Actinomycetota bacterium]
MSDTSPAGRPDIVLVVWDSARALDLPLFGFPADTAPFLEQLGRSSLVYERCVSPSPWSIPAHASMFTGRLPSQHGATELSWTLPPDVPTLAESLRRAGYHTAGVSANDLVGPPYGLDRGFDSYRSMRSASGRLRGRRGGRSRDASSTNRVVERELSQAPEDRPLFLFVNHVDAHLRYWAPRPWRFRFLPPWATPEDAERLDQSMIRHLSGTGGLDLRDLDVLRTMYHGELRFLDERLEEIVQMLRLTGRWERTVLAVVGDHGENVGDHGLLGHFYSLHQTVLWVPLVLRIPGGPSGRMPHLVQNMDLFPTLLRLGGAQVPGPIEAEHLPMEPEGGRVYAISETLAPFPPTSALRRLHPAGDWDRFDVGLRAAQDVEGMKLVAGTDGSRRLFDVSTDPFETEDAADRLPVTVERLLKVLRGTPPPRVLPPREPELDEETAARLRDLDVLD